MGLFSEGENYTLYQDDMLNRLEAMKSESADCIITDPPYELGFMGRSWDKAGVSFQKKTWARCFKVLKPGGMLLAFGGAKTHHRIACAIEDAGFEIRDCIMWVYGSGFPKSMNIGLAVDKKDGVDNRTGKIEKNTTTNNTMPGGVFNLAHEGRIAKNKWRGWGTALKPAYEPIIVARKPFKGSLVDNIEQYGVGGLNIDECRVGDEERQNPQAGYIRRGRTDEEVFYGADNNRPEGTLTVRGRFPANVIHDGLKEEWSRYFYCAKASKRDRDEGLEDLEKKHNFHPTVKPTALMQYLVRLVAPKGAIILDPFCGSGSTGKAVMYENKDRAAGYKFIGVDMDEEYLKIAQARIEFAMKGGE